MRNLVWDDARRMITLLPRCNMSPICRQAASSEVCVLVRCTIVRTQYYFTAESWEFLYIASSPVPSSCEKRVFSKNFQNNNHNLIKKNTNYFIFATYSFTMHLKCISQYTDIEINFLNSRSLYAIYVWNCAHAFTWACEWENLIVTDAKLSKRDFVGPRMTKFYSDRW